MDLASLSLVELRTALQNGETTSVAATSNSSMVSIEAESYFASLSQGEHEWTESYLSGGSGDIAMEALPNIGTIWNTDYIDNSQPRLRYDESLAKGFAIATGVIEGACRHLVKDRMDLTGARWRLTSAEAVLKLRSLKASGTLDDYLNFHFRQERARNYPWAAANDPIHERVA